MENWKNIVWAPRYSVSDLGRVKNDQTGQVLKPWKRGRYGHLSVGLRHNGATKSLYVHVLVARAFIGPKEPGPLTRHLDGNPANNRLDNLAYGTSSENQYDSIAHGTHWQTNQRVAKDG